MTYRFGLIGCGRIAARHAHLLGGGHVAGASLGAVCDIVQAKAKDLGQRYGVPYYSCIAEMMQQAELDAVSILTPSGLHAENLLEVAPYQKHIVVEKPMALTLRDADRMIRACDENDIRLFVIKQNRFNRPVTILREALDEGRFGRLVMGTVRVRWSRDQAYYDKDAWRGTWAYDGGVITQHASHHIDLLEWMMGDVQSVYAMAATQLMNIEVEDTAVVVLRFENGALGAIEATTCARPVDLEGSLSILGEHGTVEIGGFAVNEMKVWRFTESRESDATMLEDASVNPPDVYGFGHKMYYEHVVDCLKHRKKQLVDGLEGRRSLELISAIYESVETGREVSLQFRPQKCQLGRRPTYDQYGQALDMQCALNRVQQRNAQHGCSPARKGGGRP